MKRKPLDRMISLGCKNRRPRKGAVGLDAVRPAWADEHPEQFVQADAMKVPFPDGYFTEVYSSHMFEHLHKWQRVDCLKEWWRLVRLNGILRIKIPNMTKNIELYHTGKWSMEQFCDMSYGLQFIDGKVDPYEYHHYAYDQKSFRKFVLKTLKDESTKCEVVSITTGQRRFLIPDLEIRGIFRKVIKHIKGRKIIKRVAPPEM